MPSDGSGCRLCGRAAYFIPCVSFNAAAAVNLELSRWRSDDQPGIDPRIEYAFKVRRYGAQ